jgi:hypothetical protein
MNPDPNKSHGSGSLGTPELRNLWIYVFVDLESDPGQARIHGKESVSHAII